MKNKALPLMLAALIGVPVLASCGTKTDKAWYYTKADMSSFTNYEGDVTALDGSKAVEFKVRSGDPIFDKDVTKSNIKAFDMKAALQDLANAKVNYLDYETISKHEVKVKELKVDEDKQGFNVLIDSEPSKQYAVLINKDVTYNSNYHAMCIPHTEISQIISPNPQVDFEENYISGQFTWEDGGKFIVDVLSNIGNICAGIGFDSPTSAVAGVFGLLQTIGNQFCASGPTIKDVMNKLNEMDKKLDAIDEKLDQNFNQLMDEEIRTQAAVDKSILQTMEGQITDFATDYIVPLENYQRDFADYIEQSYKSYVNNEEIVNMYLVKNADNEYRVALVCEEVPASQQLVTINISNWSNAQKYLADHSNTVGEGFLDEVNKDIDTAVSTMTLPTGLTKEDARTFAHGNIIDHFTKKYYQDNHQKALDLRNMFINYAKRISGRLSVSIVNTYISRLQYMYNFASEIKVPSTDILANILGTLDRYAGITAQACAYAETSNTEVSDEYKKAREYVQTTYTAVKEMKDSYSFINSKIMKGGFYQAKYNTYYDNPGNHCSLHANLQFKKVSGGYKYNYTDDKIENHAYISATEHRKIATRWTLMRQIGLDDSSAYIYYLCNAGAIDYDSINTYNALVDRCWISNDAYRILTGYTVRDMNDSDRSQGMSCSAQGNPGGDYYTVGNRYNFRQGNDSGSWYGSAIETTYIDAASGSISPEKMVAAWARYAESHWYWRNDEYWAFVDNPAGNYFFALEAVAA